MDWSKLLPIRSILLSLVGFALLAVGAFRFQTWLGLVVLGVEILLIAYLTDPAPDPEPARR